MRKTWLLRMTLAGKCSLLAWCLVMTPGPLSAQDYPEAQAVWGVSAIQPSFCIDFLMDSAAAAKQTGKIAGDYQVLPAIYYSRLNPALAGLVERRPEFAGWIPATLCIIAADTVTVGGRVTTDEDPEERQMVGFWGIAARPPDQPLSDSLLLAPLLFTSNHRISRNSELKGLKIETVEEDRGTLPDSPGDRYYDLKVKKTNVHWAGHLAGSPEPSPGRAWTLLLKGTRNSTWTADIRLRPTERQFLVGSLRILGDDDLAKALKDSPMRMQGPAFWGGAGRFAFSP